MAELVSTNGVRFTLAAGEVLIGRKTAQLTPDIDLATLDGGQTVSRRHARIYRSRGTWYLKVDPSAQNMTSVAGQNVGLDQEAVLHDGDEIQLGNVTLRFAEREPPPSDPNATIMNAGQATAALRAGDQIIPIGGREGLSLTLGRRSEDQRYRPTIDLRDLPGGTTVSRRHGELYRQAGHWFLRVQADVTNPTYLNGRQLQPGQEVPLANGDELRFGRVIATFQEQKPDHFVSSDVLELTLGPPTEVRLEAGTEATLPLTLVNFSSHVDWFQFGLTGIPTNWWRIAVPGSDGAQPPLVRLLPAAPPVSTPDATARATIVFTPPRQADARAGTYPITVSATSQGDEHLRRSATGQLILLPYISLQMAVDPPAVRGGRARYRLTVHNDGNAPASAQLAIHSDAKLAHKLEHTEIALANGGEAVVGLETHIKRRPWLGPENTYVIRADAVADQAIATQNLTFTCPPRIPVWLQNAFARLFSILKPIVVPLAIIGVLLVVAAVILLPPDVALKADPEIIASGGTATLSWKVDRGDGTAVLDTETNPKVSQQVGLPTGKSTVSPDQTTVYALTAHNWFGLDKTGKATLKVLRVVSFTVSAETIKQQGDPVTLEWATENATALTIEPPTELASPLAMSGKAVVHPSAGTTYRLTATNAQFKASATAEVRVGFGNPKITQFQPDKAQMFPGDRVVLTWAADGFSKLSLKSNTDDLVLNGSEVDVTKRTSFEVRPIRSGQYTLVAVNADRAPVEEPLTLTVVPIRPPRLQGPGKPVSAGDSVTLSWQIEGANEHTTATMEPSIGDVSGKSRVDIIATHSTQYTLSVTGADGKTVSSDPLTLQVLPAVRQFSALPAVITEGDQVRLTWDVADADSVTITRDDGLSVTGSPIDEARDRPPASVSSYTLKARNATGQSIDSPAATVRIKVQPMPILPPAAPQSVN